MKTRITIMWLLLVMMIFAVTACQPADLADQVIFNNWSSFIALHEGESTGISIPWAIFNDKDISVNDYEISMEGLPEGCAINSIQVTPGADMLGARFYTITASITGVEKMEDACSNVAIRLQNRVEQSSQELPLGEWTFTVFPQQNHLQIKDFIGKTSGDTIVVDFAFILENMTADEVTVDRIHFELPCISLANVYYDRADSLDNNEWKSAGNETLLLQPNEKLAVRYEFDHSEDHFGVFLKPVILYSINGTQYSLAAPLFESSIALSELSMHRYRILP